MRYTAILPFVAAATAFVVPDEATAQQLVLDGERKGEKTPSSWWDSLPSLDELQSSAREALDKAAEAFEDQVSKLNDYIPEIEIVSDPGYEDFLPEADSKRPGKGHHGRKGHHGLTNLTVYQAIQASNYTKKFAGLVDEYPDIVKTLNGTKANVTLFVPVDKAFEKIPDHDKKPPKEFIEKVLKYHIVPGFYPAGRVLASHTLPTAVDEADLGEKPQRLRASVGLFGVKINFYSKVIVANLFTKNGIIHGVNSILVPPPPVEKIVELFPSKFSTLLLAAKKTGLERGEDDKTTGLTIFAPTNWAFEKLGPRANAFLFNTEKGSKYLKALLLYHFVVNETLYSDAYYGPQSTGDVEAETSQYHIDLQTALHGKSLSVDIARFYGFITIKINGFTKVAIQDGIGKDGVVHVLNSVLIPPHKHKGFWNDSEGEIEVDDLIERLEPYVESEGMSDL